MKLPFTAEEFIKVFEKYNLAIWPLQFVLILAAIVAILLAIKRRYYSGKVISLILSLHWFWMGIVYHFLFFSTINKVAYGFGVVFIIQGILFLITGFIRNQFSFQVKNDIHGITGAIFIVFALTLYPLIGYYLGHVYPSSPTFGLPCPTTMFTFGMLLWMEEKCPLYIVVIPLLWSLIGFSAAFSLNIKEDAVLIVTGAIAVLLIQIRNNKKARFMSA